MQHTQAFNMVELVQADTDIMVLPRDIVPDDNAPLIIHEYRNRYELQKSKVQLSSNVFSFLLRGTKELIAPKGSTVIDPDQFLLIRSGNCLMSERMPVSSDYKSLLFFFDQASIHRFVLRHRVDLNEKAPADAFFIFPYDAFIRDFVHSMQSILEKPDDLKAQLLPIKLEEIFLYLIHQRGTDFISSLLREEPAYHDSFVQVVQQHALQQLSLQELAFLCHMSVSTFKRHFEKVFHTSPMKWFQEQRLQHAAILLKNPQCRPSDIYAEAGFESLSSFVQAYKKKFGVTPKQSQK